MNTVDGLEGMFKNVWVFLGSCSHSCFKSHGVSLLTNLCFLGRRGAYGPAHCWFQRLNRAGDIAAGDIAAGDIASGNAAIFSAAAIKSLSEQESERKERNSDFLSLVLLFPRSIFACNPYRNSLSTSFRQRLNL